MYIDLVGLDFLSDPSHLSISLIIQIVSISAKYKSPLKKDTPVGF